MKVLDFGIAKVLKDEPRDVDAHRDQARPEAIGPAALDMAARTGIIGTMAYMSPEQWGVGGTIDHRTDIWATGLILFQMLTGHHPLETLGGDPRAWVTDLDSPLPSLRNDTSDVPPELADVVDSCLKKRKDDRYADAAALLRALEPFMPGRFARGSKQVESGPYAGLRAFQEEDAGRFFGRSREIAALATRIRDTPLMATVGPSGVGKSSLLRAGVVPALKTSGEQWETLVLRPGRDPMAALAGLLAPRVVELADAGRGHRRAEGAGQAFRGGARLPGQHFAQHLAPREQARAAVRRSVRGAVHAGHRTGRAAGVHRGAVGRRRRRDVAGARGGVDPRRLPGAHRRGSALHERARQGALLPRAAHAPKACARRSRSRPRWPAIASRRRG